MVKKGVLISLSKKKDLQFDYDNKRQEKKVLELLKSNSNIYFELPAEKYEEIYHKKVSSLRKVS